MGQWIPDRGAADPGGSWWIPYLGTSCRAGRWQCRWKQRWQRSHITTAPAWPHTRQHETPSIPGITGIPGTTRSPGPGEDPAAGPGSPRGGGSSPTGLVSPVSPMGDSCCSSCAGGHGEGGGTQAGDTGDGEGNRGHQRGMGDPHLDKGGEHGTLTWMGRGTVDTGWRQASLTLTGRAPCGCTVPAVPGVSAAPAVPGVPCSMTMTLNSSAEGPGKMRNTGGWAGSSSRSSSRRSRLTRGTFGSRGLPWAPGGPLLGRKGGQSPPAQQGTVPGSSGCWESPLGTLG